MKRWQKFVLALLLIVVVSQIPFIYRRYKLGKLHAAIAVVQSQRHTTPDDDRLTEFVGVAHVHSFLGGHTTGTFEEIIAAAQANHLSFVLMTEHPTREFSKAATKLTGERDGVLFVGGNEVSSSNGDRLLLLPGDELVTSDDQRTVEQIIARRQSGLTLVAYPDEFKSWNTSGFQGIEVYNVFTNTKTMNRITMFFDGLWSYRTYPDLLFARFYDRPAASLKRWDEEITRTGRRLVAIGGADAHANIGFKVGTSGSPSFGLQLDPYQRSFRLVRLHVLLKAGEKLEMQTLLAAVGNGNCFIGYDVFGDSAGFRFTAADGNEQRIMGDEITLDENVRLDVKSPVAGRIQLIREGTVLRDEQNTDRLHLVVREKGAYRVEVYLPQLPLVGNKPWIISNPIYVR